MILDQIKNIKSGKKELRHFGYIIAAVIAIIAGLHWWRGGEYFVHWLVVAAFFALTGWLIPILLYPFHKAWMTLSVILGWLMTRAILIVLFYLILTPLGLTARLLGKEFLQRRFDRNAESYWISKEEQLTKKSVYERQF